MAAVCVFVFDRTILDPLARQDRRVEFIRESLVQLDAELATLGGGLIVRHAVAEDEVPVMLLSVGGGASRELAAEAAPSGGRRAGMRIVEESGLSRAAAGRETTAAVVDDKGNLRVPARGSDWIYTRGYPP